ncbi:MAG: RNA polymerase sigma-70 factor [Mangrovibacterium sp.]
MDDFNDHHVVFEVDFDEIYLLYYPRLLLFAIKLTGNKEESEEIVQDVFIRFWLKGSYSHIKFSIKAYLFRSVHNACLNYLKKAKGKETNSYAESVFVNETIEFCDPLLLDELETAIQKTVEELPAQCKKVFLLHRDEQLTYREIAENMNISVKTVETQISRAIKVLKKSLVEYFFQFFL